MIAARSAVFMTDYLQPVSSGDGLNRLLAITKVSILIRLDAGGQRRRFHETTYEIALAPNANR